MQRRRREAEELLQWHERLKEEEMKILELERQAAGSLPPRRQEKANVVTGAQLNRFWRNITGTSTNRFDDKKRFSMSQKDLERFFLEARKIFHEISDDSDARRKSSFADYISDFEIASSIRTLDNVLDSVSSELPQNYRGSDSDHSRKTTSDEGNGDAMCEKVTDINESVRDKSKTLVKLNKSISENLMKIIKSEISKITSQDTPDDMSTIRTEESSGKSLNGFDVNVASVEESEIHNDHVQASSHSVREVTEKGIDTIEDLNKSDHVSTIIDTIEAETIQEDNEDLQSSKKIATISSESRIRSRLRSRSASPFSEIEESIREISEKIHTNTTNASNILSDVKSGSPDKHLISADKTDEPDTESKIKSLISDIKDLSVRLNGDKTLIISDEADFIAEAILEIEQVTNDAESIHEPEITSEINEKSDIEKLTRNSEVTSEIKERSSSTKSDIRELTEDPQVTSEIEEPSSVESDVKELINDLQFVTEIKESPTNAESNTNELIKDSQVISEIKESDVKELTNDTRLESINTESDVVELTSEIKEPATFVESDIEKLSTKVESDLKELNKNSEVASEIEQKSFDSYTSPHLSKGTLRSLESLLSNFEHLTKISEDEQSVTQSESTKYNQIPQIVPEDDTRISLSLDDISNHSDISEEISEKSISYDVKDVEIKISDPDMLEVSVKIKTESQEQKTSESDRGTSSEAEIDEAEENATCGAEASKLTAELKTDDLKTNDSKTSQEEISTKTRTDDDYNSEFEIDIESVGAKSDKSTASHLELNLRDLGSEVSTSTLSSNVDEQLDTVKESPESKSLSNRDEYISGGVSHIDVRKRVSEILADTSGNASTRGDKSPRLQDFYVTTYDIMSPSPRGSPEIGKKKFLGKYAR